MGMKLYFDFMSQPSRALYIFLKTAKLPFESCPVALRKGEHLSPKFVEEVSRFQKVPVLHDGNFKLTESIAIARYLAREQKIADHWYPKDSKRQARVDEYLEWQHNNVRAFCAMYFRAAWLEPLITGSQPSPEKLEQFKDNMISCLDNFTDLWLQDGPYIAGNEISVADLWAACELEQPRMAGYDPCVGRPVLSEWWNRVRNELNPVYGEAHSILNKIAAKSKL